MSMLNILIVSVSFMILFCAYNTYQNYATSLLATDLAHKSLGILYASVACFVFVAPQCVNVLGCRLTMVLGAAMYVGYMASLIHIVDAVVLIMSVVIGFGAAILWVALGVYVTQNSNKDTYGRNTGIFWAIFQMSQVLGNLVTFLAFNNVSSTTVLFIGFTVVGGVGTAGLLCLRRPKKVSTNAMIDSDGIAPPDITIEQRSSIRSAFAALYTSIVHAISEMACLPLVLLYPIFFFTGLEMSFWAGEFTALLPEGSIGLVLTFVGIGEVIGGLSFGRLSDKFGRFISLAGGIILYSVGLALTGLFKNDDCLASECLGPSWQDVPASLYFAAVCFGLGDSCFNTNSYACLADMYGEAPEVAALQASDEERGLLADEFAPKAPKEDNPRSASAFTILQLLQNIGSAVGYFYALAYPMHGSDGTLTQVWVQTALIVISLVCFSVSRWIWKQRQHV